MSGSESEDKPTESEASIGEDTASESSDSDEEYKATSYKKRTPKIPSDSKRKFNCNHCSKTFLKKNTLYKHSRNCGPRVKLLQNIKCRWCNLEFRNQGNLATHAHFMHGDSSYKAIAETESYAAKCEVCHQSFSQKYKLKYHIRKMHFNLKAKRPYAEMKKINQVWFEKVLNSNNVIEIKKTGLNTLVMRKLDENTAIKVRDVETETIDLRHLYPCDDRNGQRPEARAICDFCKGVYNKRDLKKHMEEVHLKIAKHHCNNCNRSFKRSYQYIQHVCNKQRKVRGVRQGRLNVSCTNNIPDTRIRITSVESLSMPWA